MVLVAIDKQNRRVLGYLCRNNNELAYCCGECDIEYSRSMDLERHMQQHDGKLPSHLDVELPAIAIDERTPDNKRQNSETMMEIEKIINDAVDDVVNENFTLNVSPSPSIDGGLEEMVSPPQPSAVFDVPKENGEPAAVVGNECEPIEGPPVVKEHKDELPQWPSSPSPSPTANEDQSNDSHPPLVIPIKQCSVALIRCDDLVLATQTDRLDAEHAANEATNQDPDQATEDVDRPTKPSAKGKREGRATPQYDRVPPAAVALRPIKCERCSAKFLNAKKLQWHMDSAHANFVCFLCGEKFKTNLLLAAHQRSHEAAVQAPVFPCNLCGMDVTNLKRHMDQYHAAAIQRARLQALSGMNANASAKRGRPKGSITGGLKVKSTKRRVKAGFEAATTTIGAASAATSMATAMNHRIPTPLQSPNPVDSLATMVQNNQPPQEMFSDASSSGSSAPAVASTSIRVPPNAFQSNGLPVPPECHSCPTCHKQFPKKPLLMQHFRSHDTNRIACRLCGTKLKRHYAPTHVRKYHPGFMTADAFDIDTAPKAAATAPMDDFEAAIDMDQNIQASVIMKHRMEESQFDMDHSRMEELIMDQSTHESMIFQQSIHEAIHENSGALESMINDPGILSAMETNDSILSSIDAADEFFDPSMDTSQSMRLAMESSLMFL